MNSPACSLNMTQPLNNLSSMNACEQNIREREPMVILFAFPVLLFFIMLFYQFMPIAFTCVIINGHEFPMKER